MKPSFSLKWLFVGIAFLALICGWIADRLRWNAEVRQTKAELMELRSHQFGMLEHLHVHAPFTNTWPAGMPSGFGHDGDELHLIGGELGEKWAYAVVASGFPMVELYKVKVSPEAQAVLELTYEWTSDGDYQRYRLHRPWLPFKL